MLAIIEGYVYPAMPRRIEHGAPEAAGGYNIAPTQQVNLLFREDDALVASTARWWFVPHWFKDAPETWKATTFNAKIETAHEKPTFRQAWRSGRCLIPAMGYYEWTGTPGSKQPHYIRPDSNRQLTLMAGLTSRLPSGLRTCTILTRPALHQINHLHPRMPVILSGETAERWLDHTDDDGAVIESYGTEWEGRMLADKVAKFSSRDDGPELIEPLQELL